LREDGDDPAREDDGGRDGEDAGGGLPAVRKQGHARHGQGVAGRADEDAGDDEVDGGGWRVAAGRGQCWRGWRGCGEGEA
jgi:hypothetical protein